MAGVCPGRTDYKLTYVPCVECTSLAIGNGYDIATAASEA